MKLLTVDSLEQAREKLLKYTLHDFVSTKMVLIDSALGCILAEDIIAPINVPDFPRSTVDGYAVISKDIQAASESVPSFLKITDDIYMGQDVTINLQRGECAYVPTGGMLPGGSDAVVMIENCEHFNTENIAVYESVANKENIVDVGDDVKKGQKLLEKGRKISPREIGVLASLGRKEVEIYNKLKITIISTGDEILSIDEELKKGYVYDINTYSLASLARQNGMIVNNKHIVKDDEQLLENTIKQSLKDSDIIIVSGGSSQGKKDVTAKVINDVASCGVLTHGLALKPGKPTITGYDEDTKTVLIGLPGHPVAAMIVFELLGVWLQNKLMNVNDKFEIIARMETNVASAPGRSTCQLVSLRKTENGYLAIPVHGKSGLMSTLIQSDGYIIINRFNEGVQKGENVYVTLF